MSNETKTNWSINVLVIGLCAAIGFGAVYAMVGFDDKNSTTELRKNLPERNTGAETASVAALPGSVLTQPDGKPLNRGAMTTFVFKKQPLVAVKSPKFNGDDGAQMDLSAFKGKVVLLNLWATWCAPCRKEMPDLNALQKELGGVQFEVVALSIDRGTPEKPKEFLAEVGASALKFYHDPTSQAGFALMAIGMPTTLLIDRQGREIGRLVGPADWHSPEALDLIRAALAAN